MADRKISIDNNMCRAQKFATRQWFKGYIYKYRNNGFERWFLVPVDSEKMEPIDINPLTKGLCLGYTDVNGKEIFEGDVLRLTDKGNNSEWIAILRFGNSKNSYSVGFYLERYSGSPWTKDLLIWIDREDDDIFCEIIGNIHDNTEYIWKRKR